MLQFVFVPIIVLGIITLINHIQTNFATGILNCIFFIFCIDKNVKGVVL